MNRRQTGWHARRRTAFSLMEVLISMAIFAIGFSTVASLFPVATLLQREAVDESETQLLERSIKAYLQARPFLASKLNSDTTVIPTDQRVHPLLPLYNPKGGAANFPIDERSSPSTSTWDERKFYWVPMVRRINQGSNTPADEWQVFVFILKSEGKREYGDSSSSKDWANYPDSGNVPGVKKIPNVEITSLSVDINNSRFNFDNRLWKGSTPEGEADQIRAGDQVLDSNGIIYTVIASDANGIEVDGQILRVPNDPTDEFSATPFQIWYSKPPDRGKRSPERKIIVVNDAVR